MLPLLLATGKEEQDSFRQVSSKAFRNCTAGHYKGLRSQRVQARGTETSTGVVICCSTEKIVQKQKRIPSQVGPISSHIFNFHMFRLFGVPPP